MSEPTFDRDSEPTLVVLNGARYAPGSVDLWIDDAPHGHSCPSCGGLTFESVTVVRWSQGEPMKWNPSGVSGETLGEFLCRPCAEALV